MVQSIGFPTADFEKSEARQHSILTATFLARLSGLLTDKRFHTFMGDDAARFDWATGEIQARLRKDLCFQLRQGLNIRFDDDASLIDQLKLTAGVCEAEISRLQMRWDFDLPKKAWRFVVPRGSDFATEVFSLFEGRPDAPKIKDMNRPFYLWNSIDALNTYIAVRKTLAVDTGHAKLEAFLSGLTEEYLLSGYPHDILAHDVRTVLSGGKKILGLLVRKEWCSTWTVDQKMASEQGLTEREGFDFVAMR